MKMMMKIAALAAMTLPATALIPAAAQAQQTAVANLEGAVQQSAAYQGATAQIRTTYKTQIDTLTARQNALNAELQPLITALQNAQQAPNATEASVKPHYDAAQNKRNAIQAELAPLYAPIQRVQAYVEEQITAKLDAAVKAAMKKRGTLLIVRPEAAFIADPAADITTAVTAELNTLIPTASITVPANWQPGQPQPAAAAPAPAATPAKQPQGR
ncbi:MAG: hypothetical protein ABS87_08725 [Sphingomonas sp. SCN 67-18]|uniref:OmpH family outer membrane protein n=1 Tax=uncultured Sphingomonas sp. TaxID=158754 RepID=UPI000869CA3D|nr:OmpH family outer membrane protein [Sphingomonas sp. SCN 67-18]ODU20913.1 MAG: hypothetical protein ABS87_08725 [Sphingomonas sp. SCN 67-18]